MKTRVENADYILSIPAGVATLAVLIVSTPSNFPHQGRPDYISPTLRQRVSRLSLAGIDASGTFVLLGATLLLVVVLLEAGT